MAGVKSSYYEFFEFRLDLEKQQLLKSGQPVQLSHKAFQILILLVQNSGQTTKKEDIFEQLWSDSFVEDANLTQHIYVLRKVLGRTPDGQSYIETVPRQGYRFTLRPEQIFAAKHQSTEPSFEVDDNSLVEINDFSLPESESGEAIKDGRFEKSKPAILNGNNGSKILSFNDTGETLTPGAKSQVKIERVKKKRRYLVVIAGLFLLCGLVVGAVYYFRQKTHQITSAADIKSIAVLPFKPLGSEVDKEKLGLGVSDAVITKLSNLQKITVRPTSAVFRYADNPPQNAVVAGRELGVDTILEGTVQCDGVRVRLSVQLIRVSDGKPLWADSFQEKVSDIFWVQDSISAKVASALSLNLTPQQEQILAERPTNNAEASQAYQLGVYFWNRRKKEDLLKAVEYFQRATELDPNYARAYAGLADSYSMLAYYRFADVDEMKGKAKITAEKALSLDDSLAEAHIALALAYIIKKENLSKAQELLERAVALAPYNASARHRYSWILLTNGKLDEGVREMSLARKYDPLSPATNRAYCSVLIMQRNFTDAVTQCESTIEIYVNTPNSRRALARAYFFSGRHADALNQLEIQIKTGAKEEIIAARGELAYYYAKLGRAAEAESIYAELKKGFATEPQQAFDLTLIAFALGKKNEALRYFKEMMKFSETIPDTQLSFAYDPYWDELKADPQFAPLFPK